MELIHTHINPLSELQAFGYTKGVCDAISFFLNLEISYINMHISVVPY